MTKLDTIIDVLYKTYFLLQHQFGPVDLTQEENKIKDELMSRQQVKDYLGISEATYKRKVKEGSLRPLKFPGGDRFYKSELFEEYIESIRKGRI